MATMKQILELVERQARAAGLDEAIDAMYVVLENADRADGIAPRSSEELEEEVEMLVSEVAYEQGRDEQIDAVVVALLALIDNRPAADIGVAFSDLDAASIVLGRFAIAGIR